jgi:hypothetical protein
LKALVDELPEELLPDALYALRHLEDDEPLSPEETANLESSREDFEHGRVSDPRASEIGEF